MTSLSKKSAAGGPVLGYLALSPTVILFTLNHAQVTQIDPVIMTFVLLVGGAMQVLAGLKARQSGQLASAAAFIPLGLFWFSMIGLYQFPAMGIGHSSSPLNMLIYLTMWGFFVAILYLGSFQQNRALQMVFSMLMISLLLMAVSEIRNNQVFDSAAAAAGVVSGLAAFYTGLAKCVNQGLGRVFLPVGKVSSTLDAEIDEQLSN
jgi:hypothetical protein